MLNKNGVRELAYMVKIDNILPIESADRVEVAVVGGWRVMVKKDEFKPGDMAVYFEIDSKVPEREPFMFLAPKHFKVKTQKYFRGTVISQGLIMSLEDFGDEPWALGMKMRIAEGKDVEHEFLTEVLGVKYSVAEDNKRKSNKVNTEGKYQRMAARHPKLAKQKWFRWLMKRGWGKRLLFLFFGKTCDKPKDFPDWIKKTDEERCENMAWILNDKRPWIVSEKIDGTSSTYAIDFTKRKPDFIVCSRNVRQLDMKQPNYHSEECENNVYWEMAFKYNIENALFNIAESYGVNKIVLQGETYGANLQGNIYGIEDRRFAAFNLIFDGIRLNSLTAKAILEEYDIPFVPIVDEAYILPDDFEEFKLSADGKSTISDSIREGFVYRSVDGEMSFKNVSRNFLIKKGE